MENQSHSGALVANEEGPLVVVPVSPQQPALTFVEGPMI